MGAPVIDNASVDRGQTTNVFKTKEDALPSGGYFKIDGMISNKTDARHSFTLEVPAGRRNDSPFPIA